MRVTTSQVGFSLVELMVSVALGIVLTFGVVQVFTNSKQTYRTQDELSRLQENARFALDILAKDIRMVGFIGCPNIASVTPTETGTTFNYTAAGVFTGNQSTGSDGSGLTGTLPPNFDNADRIPHTDVILVQSAGRCAEPLTGDMADASANISIAAGNRCGFESGDAAIVSNCATADIFRITNDPGTTGTLAHTSLSSAYTLETGPEVLNLSSNTYFIGEDTSGLPALFFVDNTEAAPAPIALVEGVENMQIQYGIDSDADGTPNVYVDADGVADWSQITVARITLLMRTINDVGTQAMEFDVGGTTTTYPGGPIRQQFVTTVKLRNRGL